MRGDYRKWASLQTSPLPGQPCQNEQEQTVMPEVWRMPSDDVPLCPHCQRDLSFVASWTFRGRWGYNEVRTYECAEHGPVFISPTRAVAHGFSPVRDRDPEDGDRASLVSAPRKPTPTLDADAIAMPEPDSD